MTRPSTPSCRHLKITALVAAACWVAAAMVYLVTEAVTASAFSPAYSYAHNYISDLGVPDCGAIFDGRAICSPLHGIMNVGFVLQGFFFLGGAVAIAPLIQGPTRYPLIGLAALNGVGLGLIGVFPENVAHGPGATTGLHVLGAFLAIVAGNATALLSAFAFRGLGLPTIHRRASVALPSIAAVAFVLLVFTREKGTVVVFPDGVWERLSVYTITVWELTSAACVLFRRKTP